MGQEVRYGLAKGRAGEVVRDELEYALTVAKEVGGTLGGEKVCSLELKGGAK